MAKKRRIKSSANFFPWISHLREKSLLSAVIIIFFAFYPGQNYYQKLIILPKKLNTISLPKDLSLNPAPYPLVKGTSSLPNLTAKAVVLMDIPSSVVLYEKNGYLTLSPASTTKIMTALVALSYYKTEDILTVRHLEADGSLMGLSIGDKVTVNNLLYGLLINSGNDAALVLADNFPGGKTAFVVEMNKKAFDYNLTRTHFVNVNGFSESGHFTTALDLTRLSGMALQNPLFQQIVSTKTLTVTDITGKKLYHLENVNKLLGKVPWINGIKTGWTNEAGECLVASAQKDGKRLVSVILGSQDRFSETTELLNWGFSNFSWVPSLDTR